MSITLSDRIKIRKAYSDFQEDLEKGVRMSPYAIGIDWMSKFSPIEDNVWSAIRYLGLPLFPQYPVGRYFIDFADPYRKIAIEVDSIKWHRNKDADRRREWDIRKLGWKVYRIPSWMTMNSSSDYVDQNGDFAPCEEYFENTAEGFLIKLYENMGDKDSDNR
jgi:very-short-patch-repair endonuclease